MWPFLLGTAVVLSSTSIAARNVCVRELEVPRRILDCFLPEGASPDDPASMRLRVELVGAEPEFPEFPSRWVALDGWHASVRPLSPDAAPAGRELRAAVVRYRETENEHPSYWFLFSLGEVRAVVASVGDEVELRLGAVRYYCWWL